jgi:hypothetical protein
LAPCIPIGSRSWDEVKSMRPARLIADVVAMKLGRPEFTWGSANLVKEGEARNKYLEVIRTADNGDIQPLLKFARS